MSTINDELSRALGDMTEKQRRAFLERLRSEVITPEKPDYSQLSADDLDYKINKARENKNMAEFSRLNQERGNRLYQQGQTELQKRMAHVILDALETGKAINMQELQIRARNMGYDGDVTHLTGVVNNLRFDALQKAQQQPPAETGGEDE